MEKNGLSNDCIRNNILKSVMSENIGNINEVDEGTLIYSYSKKLEQLKNMNDSFYVVYLNIISVAYFDTYKILNSKLRDSNISFLELQLYNKIRFVTCIEDLEMLINNDEFLLEEILKYSLEFLRMNNFQKIISMKKLSNNQKYFLKTYFPSFELDIEQYGFTKDVPIEIMTDYYTKEIKKAEENENVDACEKSNQLVEEIEGFIKNLMANDYVNYVSLMENIITMDYKWCKYVIDKRYRTEAFNLDEMVERVEMYENNTLQQLVDEASTEEYYFETLIDFMIFIKCDNMYFDEKVLNEIVVEEYFETIHTKKRKK